MQETRLNSTEIIFFGKFHFFVGVSSLFSFSRLNKHRNGIIRQKIRLFLDFYTTLIMHAFRCYNIFPIFFFLRTMHIRFERNFSESIESYTCEDKHVSLLFIFTNYHISQFSVDFLDSPFNKFLAYQNSTKIVYLVSASHAWEC